MKGMRGRRDQGQRQPLRAAPPRTTEKRRHRETGPGRIITPGTKITKITKTKFVCFVFLVSFVPSCSTSVDSCGAAAVSGHLLGSAAANVPVSGTPIGPTGM